MDEELIRTGTKDTLVKEYKKYSVRCEVKYGRYKETILQRVLCIRQKNDLVDVISSLMETGADCNSGDQYRNTLLMSAAKVNNTDIVMFLLKNAKCDKHRTNIYGLTFIHMAAFRGHLPVLTATETLLEKKDLETLVNKKMSSNCSFLRYFTSILKPESRWLCIKGWYPLHCAAAENNFKVVKWLIQHGAKAEVRNADMLTPYDLISKLNLKDDFTSMKVSGFLKAGKKVKTKIAPAAKTCKVRTPADGNCTQEDYSDEYENYYSDDFESLSDDDNDDDTKSDATDSKSNLKNQMVYGLRDDKLIFGSFYDLQELPDDIDQKDEEEICRLIGNRPTSGLIKDIQKAKNIKNKLGLGQRMETPGRESPVKEDSDQGVDDCQSTPRQGMKSPNKRKNKKSDDTVTRSQAIERESPVKNDSDQGVDDCQSTPRQGMTSPNKRKNKKSDETVTRSQAIGHVEYPSDKLIANIAMNVPPDKVTFLGIFLGLSHNDCKVISAAHHYSNEIMLEILVRWRNNSRGTQQEKETCLIEALREIGANNVVQKYFKDRGYTPCVPTNYYS